MVHHFIAFALIVAGVTIPACLNYLDGQQRFPSLLASASAGVGAGLCILGAVLVGARF